jgi:hypothetical protein
VKTIAKWWKAESAMIVAVALALVNASVIPGVAGRILGAVLPIIGGAAVRQTVWAPDTVATLTTPIPPAPSS